MGYEESVDSVQFMTVDDITELKEKQRAQINIGKAISRYEDEYVLLSSVMKEGRLYAQTELFDMLQDEEVNPNGCTKKTLRNCIDLLKGNNLKLERKGAHGKKYYRWIPM